MADRTKGLLEKASEIVSLSASSSLLDTLILIQARSLTQTEEKLAEARSILDTTKEDLADELARKMKRGTTPETRAKFDAAISGLEEITTAGIVGYGKRVQAEARGISSQVVVDSAAAVKEAADGVGFGRALSQAQVGALGNAQIIGDTAGQWFGQEAVAQGSRLMRELRVGYALGESVEDLAGRINLRTNLMGQQVEALARTVVQGWSNEAAHNLYDANSDVLSGKQWIATLDQRTCPQCGPLDGRIWWYGRKSPSVDGMPQAPLHPQCRCFVAPLVAGLSNPQVPTWGEWLGRQPRAIQDEVLGPGRARLWREKDITINQMRDAHGGIRPVKALQRLAGRG